MTITVLTIIFGSFLGFIATLASSMYTANKSDKSKKRSHAQYLKLELTGTIKSLDEIRIGYEHQHFYDFLLLDLLDRNVDNLHDARKQAYLISDEKLQEQVFAIINRISILAKEMRSIQDHVYRPNVTNDENTGEERPMNKRELQGKEDLIKDKRQSNLMEILDLKREIKSIVSDLMAN